MKEVVMRTMLLSLLTLSGQIMACSCFAVFTPAPVYGMNFDYPPEATVGFVISREDCTTFEMVFSEEGREGWIPTVGMNEWGVFSSMQYECPMETGAAELSSDEMYPYHLYGGALGSCSTFTEVKGLLGENTVQQMEDLSLHTFLAAPDGRAMIVETGEDGNEITTAEDNRLVMTNFPVWECEGIPSEDIQGVGADRYRAATEAIEEEYSGFSVESGIDVLHAARNTDAVWGTKASMVFDPGRNHVYVSIDNDFTRIWRVSLDTGTWETWRGFTEERTLIPEEDFITVPELREWL